MNDIDVRGITVIGGLLEKEAEAYVGLRTQAQEAAFARDLSQIKIDGYFATMERLGADSVELALAWLRFEDDGEVNLSGVRLAFTRPNWREEDRKREEEDKRAECQLARFTAAMEGARLESAEDLRAVLAKMEEAAPVAPPVAVNKAVTKLEDHRLVHVYREDGKAIGGYSITHDIIQPVGDILVFGGTWKIARVESDKHRVDYFVVPYAEAPRPKRKYVREAKPVTAPPKKRGRPKKVAVAPKPTAKKVRRNK